MPSIKPFRKIENSMICKTCNTEIFPVRWSEDIERIFEYQQKAFGPKSATFKLKKLTLILLVVVIVLVVILNIYLFNN